MRSDAKKQAKKNMLWHGPQVMSKEKLRILINVFFTSKFEYCLFGWKIKFRLNRLNKLQERALRSVYNDIISSFNALFAKRLSNSLSKCPETARKIYKVIHRKAPKVMDKLFSQLNLCKDVKFRGHNIIRTALYGTETQSYLVPEIWNLVPPEIRSSETVANFRKKIEKWKPDRC